MIERQIIMRKTKELQIKEYIASQLTKAGYSKTEIQRTPLGDKVIIYASRPGLVVGRKGENISKLTKVLKSRFKMENPQIEIGEVEEPHFDVKSIAERIAYSLETFGSKRFKSIGYKTLQNIINAGALGAEIVIGGRGVPGARAKSWRFSAGYLKKSGDISENKIRRAQAIAKLKSGAIGIKVSIMTPDIQLPDKITIRSKEELEKIKSEETKEIPKKQTKKKRTKKLTRKKKPVKKDKENGDNKEKRTKTNE